jgi:hypothetical protein
MVLRVNEAMGGIKRVCLCTKDDMQHTVGHNCENDG